MFFRWRITKYDDIATLDGCCPFLLHLFINEPSYRDNPKAVVSLWSIPSSRQFPTTLSITLIDTPINSASLESIIDSIIKIEMHELTNSLVLHPLSHP